MTGAEQPGAADASLFQPAVGGDPAYHALVIGVSRYRHLPGGSGPAATHPLAAGLTQLSAAASSALRVAQWIRDSYAPPDVSQGSIRLLLSPSPGEDVSDAPGAPAATAAEVQRAVARWRRDVRAHSENVALVYVAGHGIQLTMEGGILLLEDFADPDAVTPLAGAVDLQSVRRGVVSDPVLPGTCTPRLQYYFYDACRIEPTLAGNYIDLPVGVSLDRPRGNGPKASWVCFGSRPRDYAFADPATRATLYSQAFLDCLDTSAATHDDGRTVRFAELQPALEESLSTLAQRYGEEQVAEFGGGGSSLVAIHRRPELSFRGAGFEESRDVPTRSVRFEVVPPMPVFARAGDVVMGETGEDREPVQMPVGDGYEVVVPLPWGGEYVESLDVPDGGGELSVHVAVPPSLLKSGAPAPGTRFESRQMTDDGFGCRIRLLRWIGDQFEVFPTMTKVIELTTFDTGQVRLILEPRTPPSGLAPLLQVATERGPSEIVALPVSGDEVRRCVVLLDPGPHGTTVSVRPESARSANVAGYLQSGRPDRALTALSSDAATLLQSKMADPVGAAIGGYALLKLNRLDQVHDWCDNLARRFPNLPDGAIIAGAVAAGRGQFDSARAWFREAFERGIPVFSEGLSLLAAEARSLGEVPRAAEIARLASVAQLSALCTTIRADGVHAPTGGWLDVTPGSSDGEATVSPHE